MPSRSLQVFAVRYAHRQAFRREAFYGGDPHDGPMSMDYFVWVIVGSGAPIVVDVGFTPEVGTRRGRQTLSDPVEVMAALGVDANAVEDVILTHLHYDHCGQVGAFPRARFWVQDKEMDFWTGRFAGRAAFRDVVEPDDIAGLVRLNFAQRLRFVDGAETVAEGVTVHHVGGHTPGLQVVVVETADGNVVLASDSSHYYANLEEDRPFSIVNSLPDMYGAFDRLRELACGSPAIVPGHDPLVLERYRPAAPGLEGLAVRITP